MQGPKAANQTILSYADIAHSMRFLSFFGWYVAPFYGLSAEQFERQVLPTLLLSQGLIYQADAVIEAAQKGADTYRGLEPWHECRRTLIETLRALDLYTPMMEAEADNVTTYWQIEDEMMMAGRISDKLIDGAIKLRVSDIMLLHAICHRLVALPNDNETWAIIRIFEELRDLEADIIEYADDVRAGDFNIYRMMIKQYGTNAAQRLEHELEMRRADIRRRVDACSAAEKTRWNGLLERYYTGRPMRPVPVPIPEGTSK